MTEIKPEQIENTEREEYVESILEELPEEKSRTVENALDNLDADNPMVELIVESAAQEAIIERQEEALDQAGNALDELEQQKRMLAELIIQHNGDLPDGSVDLVKEWKEQNYGIDQFGDPDE